MDVLQIANLLHWANSLADLVQLQHANVVVGLDNGTELTAIVRRLVWQALLACDPCRSIGSPAIVPLSFVRELDAAAAGVAGPGPHRPVLPHRRWLSSPYFARMDLYGASFCQPGRLRAAAPAAAHSFQAAGRRRLGCGRSARNGELITNED
jgi:hypothetical protein